MGDVFKKLEKDYTDDVDVALREASTLRESGRLDQALERIWQLEKQTRNGSDLASTRRCLVALVQLTYDARDWPAFDAVVLSASKKHGQIKEALKAMVEKALELIEIAPGSPGAMPERERLQSVESLISVTEGKIFVEVARARLTIILAKDQEAKGQTGAACDTLNGLQVETFGSMERREKTEFILEQMRLLLLKGDWVRLAIVSRKINPKFFETKVEKQVNGDAKAGKVVSAEMETEKPELEHQDLKLRYYRLVIELALHDEDYIEACKHYRAMFDTPIVQRDADQWEPILRDVVFYIVLAPFNNESSDLIQRIKLEEKLVKLPLCTELVRFFTTNELMRWPSLQSLYSDQLRDVPTSGTTFDHSEAGGKRWQTFHHRVIEHNIRVIARYYTQITVARLSKLLDLSANESEEFVSRLVVGGTIYARIDRLGGLINFVKPRDANETLDSWASDIGKMLNMVEKVCHLISKEEARVAASQRLVS